MPEGGQADIDKDRVTVLLLINSLLIKKAHDIYATVLSNRLAIQQMPPQSRHNILEQYNNINRRLQCNLSVLSHLDNLYDNRIPARQANRIEFPVILSPPSEMPELRLLYKRLQELYPEAIEFLRMKMNQLKLLHESQIRPFNSPQVIPNPQNAHTPHVLQQQNSQATQKASTQVRQQQAQQQDLLQNLQRQQHQGVTLFSDPQSNTPSQFQSPQLTVPQARGHSLVSVASKIPVQYHLPQHHSKRLDVPFAGGISPQMMSKEPHTPAYGDHSSIFNSEKNMNNSIPTLLSISPQQILEQQSNDLSMNFL